MELTDADLPGANTACVFYGYRQTIRDMPEMNGKILESLGLGNLCVDTDGPPDGARVVLAEISETWFPTLGQLESSSGASEAQRSLSSLRIR